MKRAVMSMVCIGLIVCCSFSTIAHAANETDASTTVTYTKSGNGDLSPAPTTASYEINIPSEISLNSGRELYITANSMNLNPEQSVIVSVDYDRTYTTDITTTDNGIIEDSYLKLMNTNGVDFAKVNINRHDYEVNAGTILNREDSTAAIFEGSSLQPTKYGLLYLNLYRPTTLAEGTYTGTIYFTIELVDG